MLPGFKTIHRLTHPNEKIERQLDQIQTQNRQIIDYLKVIAYYEGKRGKP